MRLLLRSGLFAACLSLVAVLAGSAQTIGPSLQSALDSAGLLDRLQVVVAFDSEGPLTPGQKQALGAVGVAGFHFRSLPIAGVVATSGQVDQILSLPGVRSVWLNDRLEWENEIETQSTGVDRLREDAALRTAAGLPYSGSGVGILINDSGIDATHPDLKNVVTQNVAGQTNLAAYGSLLPVTYVEDVPNTDHGGGHGTHVAAIAAGTGAASGGRFEGVAPGADVIGYGSGAAVALLDVLGGFDYALTHQFEYNIRIVSNSFGESDDYDSDFQPDHPANVATRALADRGMVVLFSAGNNGSGQGSISGNYKKAPWVVTVGATDTQGVIADFSSRGRIDGGGTFTDGRGETHAWEDRPTVTAPGVAVVSANASTGSLHFSMHPEFAPYYTVASGTSMACPHVAGIVALMLEADPQLDWRGVKDILQKTATNLPGRDGWEAGAGYVNAHAAVAESVLRRSGSSGFGATVNLFRTFNSNAVLSAAQPDVAFDLGFSPAGDSEALAFQVLPGTELVSASAVIGDNTAALVLHGPDGSRHASAVSVPGYQSSVTVTAAAIPGTWTLEIRGAAAWVGLQLDLLGLTNGYGAPGRVRGRIGLYSVAESGISDLDGDDADALIVYAVSRRLIDGDRERRFRSREQLRRADLAEYLVMGTPVRQVVNGPELRDVDAELAPFAGAVSARGGALRDLVGIQNGLVRIQGDRFDPRARVHRVDLAYAFVQSLGLEAEARAHSGPVYADAGGSPVELSDWQEIPAELRGHAQLALLLGLLDPVGGSGGGLYFRPDHRTTRGEYALAAVRFADGFQAEPLPDLGLTAKRGTSQSPRNRIETPVGLALSQNYPNPFNPSTTISFSLNEEDRVRLEVFDLTGRLVTTLVDGTRPAGTHRVLFSAGGLSSGRYLYRLSSSTGIWTRSMLLVK